MGKFKIGLFFLISSIGISTASQAASPASKEYVDQLIQQLKTPPTYTVGEQALGGTVFYINSAGTHGLVMANTDQAAQFSKNWYEASDVVTDPGNYDSAGALYTDWYLPSLTQLQTLCLAASALPTPLTSNHYWSATMQSLGSPTSTIDHIVVYAYVVDMSSCPQELLPIERAAPLPLPAIRAIRSF